MRQHKILRCHTVIKVRKYSWTSRQVIYVIINFKCNTQDSINHFCFAALLLKKFLIFCLFLTLSDMNPFSALESTYLLSRPYLVWCFIFPSFSKYI